MLLAAPLRLAAIELSLEENRAERGNIGFVDTQRLFKLFPETLKAKENFEEAVRQAEEQINLRKADVLRLRAQLDTLKVERESLIKSTPTASAPAAAAVAAQPAVSTATLAAPARLIIPDTALVSTAPPAAVAPAAAALLAKPALSSAPAAAPTTAVSTAAASAAQPALSTMPALGHLPGFAGMPPPAPSSATAAQPLIINLPGATAGPMVVAPPSAGPVPGLHPAAPATLATAAPPPVPSTAPAASAPPADAAIAALDARIAQTTRELERKQREAQEAQAAAEKDLLDLESRRSEILLGKIYKAVQEVSRREGVSVVVDKSGILYGHNAVDLTDKVLKYLKGG